MLAVWIVVCPLHKQTPTAIQLLFWKGFNLNGHVWGLLPCDIMTAGSLFVGARGGLHCESQGLFSPAMPQKIYFIHSSFEGLLTYNICFGVCRGEPLNPKWP